MISIELSKRFKKIVRDSGREHEVSEALTLVLQGFGNPHVHAGLSIRKLGNHLYECRTGLAWQLVFLAKKGVLSFVFAGNHDEVKNYLRSYRQTLAGLPPQGYTFDLAPDSDALQRWCSGFRPHPSLPIFPHLIH